jgi:hypothetical protein
MVNQMDERNNGVTVSGVYETGKMAQLFPPTGINISSGPMRLPQLDFHGVFIVQARIPLRVIDAKYKKYVAAIGILQPGWEYGNEVRSEPFLLPQLPSAPDANGGSRE